MSTANTPAVNIPPLVARRVLAGLSQDRVAQAAGIDRSQVSRLERGLVALSDEQASALGALFGVAASTIKGEHARTAKEAA